MSRNTKQPIQFYRGTTAQHSGYTGPAGECTVDTTKNTLVVHDGVKAGGYPLVKEDHTVTGDGYVLANGSRSTTIGSRTLALSLDTAALRNLLADPSGTDAVAGNLKLSDAVDSSLDAATGGTAATPKAVKTAIASEASARETADTALQKRVTDEASARMAADTTLQHNLTNEASARDAADITLRNNLTNEIHARESADTAIRKSVTDEASAREAADNAFQKQIDDAYAAISAAYIEAGGTLDG